MKEMYKVVKEGFSVNYRKGISRKDAEKLFSRYADQGCGDDYKLLKTFDNEEEAEAFAKSIKLELDKSTTVTGGVQLNIKAVFVECVSVDEDGDEVDTLSIYSFNAPGVDELMDFAFPQSDDDDDNEEKPMKQIWKIGVETYSTTVNRYRKYEAERKIENIYAELSCNSVVEQWAFDSKEKALAFAETLEPELDIRIESSGCHILVTEINIGCKMVEDDEDDFDINQGCDEYGCVKHIATDEIISKVFPPADDDDEDDDDDNEEE